MSTDEVTVRFSRQARNTLLGKGVVVVLTAVVMGLSMNADDRRNSERAASLTLEQYTSEFESHKAALASDVLPPVANFLGALFALAGAFALYELAGWLLGRAVGALQPARADLRAPSDPGAA